MTTIASGDPGGILPPPASAGRPPDTTPSWIPDGEATSPESARPQRPRRIGGASFISLLLAVAGAVAIAGVAFAVGRTTAPGGQTTTATTRGLDAGGNPGVRQAPPGGFDDEGGGLGTDLRSIEGTVTAVSGDSVTLTLANGSTIALTLGSSTTFHAQTSATRSDVTTGSRVIVQVSGFRPGQDSTALTATDVTVAGG